MKILFTNGIYGEVKNNKINLIAANSCIETGYAYDAESIKKIEDKLNIRLIGEVYSQGPISKLEDYAFVVYYNGFLRNITNEMYELDSQISELYDLIRDNIFNDVDEFDRMINYSPIFIATEGLEQKFFMSKEEFQRGLSESPLMKMLNAETKIKLIYMYDLQSMIYDFKNSFYSIGNPYIFSSNELCNIVNNVFKMCNGLEGKSRYEYFYQGPQVDVLSSYFMSVIIRICSILDLLTKFIFEITNIPKEYNKFIKFKSGRIYFSNIGRFVDVFKELNNYEGSIVEKRESFQEIILVRNTIIHNSFLSIKPSITIGYGTPEINNHNLTYGKIYIWDIDEDGKATRWLNRSRFYSQSRCIQEYLLSEMLKFYFSFSKTIALFKEYLEL